LQSQCKQPPKEMESSQSTITSSIASTPRHLWGTSSQFVPSLSKPKQHPQPKGQQMLFGNALLPDANNACHIAIADFIHSNALPFSLSNCLKLLMIIDVLKNLGLDYTPPNCQGVRRNVLNSLYNTKFADVMKSLLLEAKIFGISIFGNGAMIKSAPLLNVLATGPNNPFALLDIVDCTSHMEVGGKKDAP
jgi:hypothetical protein